MKNLIKEKVKGTQNMWASSSPNFQTSIILGTGLPSPSY